MRLRKIITPAQSLPLHAAVFGLALPGREGPDQTSGKDDSFSFLHA